jgi:hypothetical protein
MLIRWHTSSEWSHVAIETPRGVYESIARGFVHHPVGTWRRIPGLTYETISVELPSPEAAQAWLEHHVGARYDLLGILAYVLPFLRQAPRALYCSEAARLWLRAGGVPIPGQDLHPGALCWFMRGLTVKETL